MPCDSDAPKTVEEFFAGTPEAIRPIGERLRTIIRKAAPQLTEVIKWSSPCYEGNGLECGIGAFKQHAALSFFHGKELKDLDGLLTFGAGNAAMGSIKYTSLSDIPVIKLSRLVKEAAAFDPAASKKSNPKARRAEITVPAELAATLKKAPAAANFLPRCHPPVSGSITSGSRLPNRRSRNFAGSPPLSKCSVAANAAMKNTAADPFPIRLRVVQSSHP